MNECSKQSAGYKIAAAIDCTTAVVMLLMLSSPHPSLVDPMLVTFLADRAVEVTWDGLPPSEVESAGKLTGGRAGNAANSVKSSQV